MTGILNENHPSRRVCLPSQFPLMGIGKSPLHRQRLWPKIRRPFWRGNSCILPGNNMPIHDVSHDKVCKFTAWSVWHLRTFISPGSSVWIGFAVEPHDVLAGQEWSPTCLAFYRLGTVSQKLPCHLDLSMMIGAWIRSACDAHPHPPSLVPTSLLYGDNVTWTMQATQLPTSPCRTSCECSIYIRTKRNGFSNDWVADLLQCKECMMYSCQCRCQIAHN